MTNDNICDKIYTVYGDFVKNTQEYYKTRDNKSAVMAEWRQ